MLAAILLAAFATIAGTAPASTPPTGTVTVPTTVGQTVMDSWTGTIPLGSHPTSTCTTPPANEDDHSIAVTVPAGAYGAVRAEFTFSISWTPVVDPTTSDEILTVYESAGNELGSSDTSGTTESVVLYNLPAGTYRVAACGFANAQPQDYTGKLVVKALPTAASQPPLPSTDPQGLAFSAAVPADAQRDEAEPIMEIDPSGKIYTCGPTGFSNAADYAQVSTDGGDQFHLLGTPPRGQQGAGGGGDCGLATAIVPNSAGNYQYAYTGLGALANFATSTSPDSGHTLTTAQIVCATTPPGAACDRQWMTFLDAQTVLLIYNQQQPRNTIVQRSTDGGLTYSTTGVVAAPNPNFPGEIRFNPNYTTGGASGLVFFAWDGNPTSGGGDSINLSVSPDRGVTWKTCRAALSTGDAAGFVIADNDSAGNIYVAYTDASTYHTYLVTLTAANISKCNGGTTMQPTVNPGFSTPLQVDRDTVNTTVFPWLVAGGAPGRVAVTFYGTTSDGNPSLGTFRGAWDVYVNQSLNALDPTNRTFSQVKATTHPFHYDSICLNGLGCDLSVPPGDRSLADFFAIDYSPASHKLSVVFDRGNKKPDEATGHVATPMVTNQIGGPANGGGTVTSDANHVVVRSSSTDPAGDALARYSSLGATPTSVNEPAGDFLSASVGPELTLPAGTPVANGGFTVTMNVANLSNTALTQAMTDTGSGSLLWIWRFTNGYQDAAVSARYAAGSFTFGFNDYTTGGSPCEVVVPPAVSEKCVVYPGTTTVQGAVDQATGKIRVSVPRSLLRALSGTDANGRPLETTTLAAGVSRFYDGTAFSFGNANANPSVQSFLYPLDNTPAMDFLLPGGATAVTIRSFEAIRAARGVVVRWRTGSEVGNVGFNVYRGWNAHRLKINTRLIRSAPSATLRGHSYVWLDRAGSQWARYWLQEVHADGTRVLRGPVGTR